jgi:hypothetical protein
MLPFFFVAELSFLTCNGNCLIFQVQSDRENAKTIVYSILCLSLNYLKESLLSWWLEYRAVVAERLRRLTRNQIPSGSVGSNPTDCGLFFIYEMITPI